MPPAKLKTMLNKTPGGRATTILNLLLLIAISCGLSNSCKKHNLPESTSNTGLDTPQQESKASKRLAISGNLPDLRDRSQWMTSKGIPTKVDINLVISHLEQSGSATWDLNGENGGYLRSLFYWCDRENSEKALGILAKCSGSASEKRTCMHFMTKAIYDPESPTGIIDAQAAIKRNFGEGMFAGDFTMNLYEHAGINQKSLDSLSQIGDPELKKRALAGLSMSLRYSKDLNSLQGIDLSKLDKSEANTVGLALANRVINSSALGLSMEQTLRESAAVLGDGTSLVALLSGCVERSPANVWALFSGGELEIDNTAFGDLKRRAVQLMSAKDAPKALKSVLESSKSTDQSESISIAMTTYLQMNDVEARSWFESNKASLQPDQLDGFEASFARFDSMKKNFTDAWKRTESIENPELKRKIEGDIWQNERKAVIEELGKDPQAFIETITSGESQHAPYWIETAMEQWVASDGDAAWAWYEESRSSLTAEQNEAVALTYARQALKAGKTETAAEWAKHVVTPKFEATIRAEIEAAAKSGQ